MTTNMAVVPETGWLIEDQNEPKWLTLKPAEALWTMVFTPDSLEAVRFARRSDAEDYVSAHLDDAPVRITEHSWSDPRAAHQAPVSPAEQVETDWIEWAGGERPVDRDALVTIRRRDGREVCDKAFKFDWTNENYVGVQSDIIAYRIEVTTPPADRGIG
jgi:hypothetical protein